MSNQIKFIGLGSQKRVGKDTFCQLLQELDPRIKRIALADTLKSILEPLSWRLYKTSIGGLSDEQKERFRPLMIEFGRAARNENIDFWCSELYEQIQIYDGLTMYKDAIYCCCDVRYVNEYNFFKKIYGDSFLMVNINRIGAPEPTDEEKIHGPEVAKLADFHLTWETDSSLMTLRPIVADFYNKFFNKEG